QERTVKQTTIDPASLQEAAERAVVIGNGAGDLVLRQREASAYLTSAVIAVGAWVLDGVLFQVAVQEAPGQAFSAATEQVDIGAVAHFPVHTFDALVGQVDEQ